MSSITTAGIVAALVSVFLTIAWLGGMVVDKHRAQTASDLFLTIAWLGGMVVDKHRAQTASDLAAVAGAYAAYYGRDACSAADRVAVVNGASVVECSVDGLDVTIRARSGGQEAVAKAGPV